MGYVYEHLLVAEKALGRFIEVEHPIHHFNEVKNDNRNQNLVICEDDAYHFLLHARQRIAERGGDPDLEKICSRCHQLKPHQEFSSNRWYPSGLSHSCRNCEAVRSAAKKRKAREDFLKTESSAAKETEILERMMR